MTIATSEITYASSSNTATPFHLRAVSSTVTSTVTKKKRRKSDQPRDAQRQKVYDAEGVLDSMGKKLPTVPEMQEYADRLMFTAWFQRRWGRRSIVVRPGYRRRRGAAVGRQIRMPKWTRYESYVLHEIAHVLTQRNDEPFHGPRFCAVLLALVEHQMGKEAAQALRESFRKHKVRHRCPGAVPPPTKPVVTKKAIVAKLLAEQSKPPTLQERKQAAALIRRAAKSGVFGPGSSKPRVHALATARALDPS